MKGLLGDVEHAVNPEQHLLLLVSEQGPPNLTYLVGLRGPCSECVWGGSPCLDSLRGCCFPAGMGKGGSFLFLAWVACACAARLPSTYPKTMHNDADLPDEVISALPGYDKVTRSCCPAS